MTDRDDLDQLLNSLIGQAQEQLVKRDGFLPYCGTLESEPAKDNQVMSGMVDIGEEYPSPLEVRNATITALKSEAQKEEIRACAVVTDVRLKEGAPGFEEAINIFLEHNSGRVVNFHLPYRKSGDVYDYGDALFGSGDSEIFSA